MTATLEDYGHPVERQSLLDENKSRIISSHYLVKLTLIDAPGDDMYPRGNGKSMQGLEISLFPIAPDIDDKDISELMLVVMLYRMIDLYPTRVVEWLSPATVLTVEQFLSAFTDISPRRVHGRQDTQDSEEASFEPVEETEQGLAMRFDAIGEQFPCETKTGMTDLSSEERLALAYRFNLSPDVADEINSQEEAQSDIRRLATWGLTGTVAFLSAPVALSMAAVNLVRGEDFRLNTNVLALTALLVMLQSTGAMASIMSRLPL